MTQLEIALASRAFRDGRALRNSRLRHRRLVKDPLVVVLWQLGGEPFSASAVGWGTDRKKSQLVVAGEPRNRDLAFGALSEFADWFNGWFERPGTVRETIEKGSRSMERATDAPQIIVANEGTAEHLGRIGRRLAYLSSEGPQAAPASLIRLGQHLLFLSRQRAVPGQQLLLSMTGLLRSHWTTPQSHLEQMSLAALDAYIEPPAGVHGFRAALRAERMPVGPVPVNEDDELEPLVEAFNRQRGKTTDRRSLLPLLAHFEAHYRPLVDATYRLVWQCRDRESAWSEAPSVERRWKEDLEAYTGHLDWTAQVGRRRTRQTARQAAMTLRRLESASALLEAEETCDDALRMIPYLLDHKALLGTVVEVDEDHYEQGPKKKVRRPIVTLRVADQCLMPLGKKLWWTERPTGQPYIVNATRRDRSGWLVDLKLETGSNVPLPTVGTEACFSIHATIEPWQAPLPDKAPWTHEAVVEPPAVIEENAT